MDGGFCSLSEFPKESRAVLRVHVDYVSLQNIDSFREACLRLLQTGMTHLTVDLSPLRRIPSGVLAAIIDIGLLASNTGRDEHVIVLAAPPVVAQFRLIEHADVLDLREAVPGQGGCRQVSGNSDATALAGA
ncbi:MAG: hypothetical protein ACYTGB_10190 [Planctomycetota bacterium]|jgi:hypothetical protein